MRYSKSVKLDRVWLLLKALQLTLIAKTNTQQNTKETSYSITRQPVHLQLSHHLVVIN